VSTSKSALPQDPCSTFEERLLTAKEVATLIGTSIDTVYRHLPCIRIGGAIRYSEVAVRRFLAENTLTSARRQRSPLPSGDWRYNTGMANKRRRSLK
jgi:predicted DNA-binding transcriptional regulator AlpA